VKNLLNSLLKKYQLLEVKQLLKEEKHLQHKMQRVKDKQF
jgi:hypothetical protein